MFYKKGVFRNFAQFTEKHLCQSLFFNKVVGLKPATLLKKKLCHRCFPANSVEFFKIPFLKNTSGRLLLNRLQERCFPVNIVKFLKIPILKNICERLLLSMKIRSFQHVLILPIKFHQILKKRSTDASPKFLHLKSIQKYFMMEFGS